MGERGTASLPSGTVTFLFTDIEGSTRLAAGLGDARWAELLEVHNRLVRAAFTTHDGVEVKTDGDAFFVAFSRATDAVASVVEAQRRLAAHSWPDGQRVRVRMGVHTGEAIVREGDYVGHHVHRASRICDAGHGGQILVSQTTADLVGETLPEGVTLVDLGAHRLKDLGSPEHLFTVRAADLQHDFRPLRTLEDRPNNLPAQLTSFVGRERELDELRTLLDATRLVTLTGPGGAGKTRLAIQVGAELLHRFDDGVFFCDLAPIADPANLWPTFARALGLQLGGGGRPVAEEVLDHLARRELLVVVDNCEHLLDASADAAEAVLTRCPKVVILATSREALNVEGERAWVIPPLAVEEDGGSAALRLFHDRAAAARADLRPAAADTAAIREICRSLDGLPLAIELAAARTTHLSPREILDRLDDRLRLLAGPRRRAQRQQTLEATLDWSHELLGPSEQVLFRRLAVFAGGFSLEALEAVCSDDTIPPGDAVSLLGSLVAQSLVVAERTADATRYRLLETVRLYAHQKLAAAAETRHVRTAHRDHFVEWVERRPLADLWFDVQTSGQLTAELDNLRAALRCCFEDQRRDLVARLARAVGPWWAWDGLHDEADEWLARALEDAEQLDRDLRVQTWLARAEVSLARMDGRMAGYAGCAVEAAAGSRSGPATLALAYQAFHLSMGSAVGRSELAEQAEQLMSRALAAAEAGSGPPWSTGVQWIAGGHRLMHGAVDEAAGHLRVALATDPGGSRFALWSVQSLAAALIIGGDCEGACAVTESLGSDEGRPAPGAGDGGPARWGNLRIDQVMVPAIRANALAACGRTAEAGGMLRAVPWTATLLSVPLVLNDWLVACAAVAWHDRDPERASRLLGRPAREGARSPAGFALCRHYVALVRTALDRETGVRYRDEGLAMSAEAVIAYALEGLGSG